MNFDAPSLPPSLIPECEPGMSGPSQGEETIRGLIDSSLHGLWRSTELGDPSLIERVRRASGRGGVAGFIKRSSDYAIAVSSLLVLWPVLLLIAALIRL